MKKNILKLGLIALSALSLTTITSCDNKDNVEYAEKTTVESLEERINNLETTIKGLDNKADKNTLEECSKELASLKAAVESYKIDELITKVSSLESSLADLVNL